MVTIKIIFTASGLDHPFWLDRSQTVFTRCPFPKLIVRETWIVFSFINSRVFMIKSKTGATKQIALAGFLLPIALLTRVILISQGRSCGYVCICGCLPFDRGNSLWWPLNNGKGFFPKSANQTNEMVLTIYNSISCNCFRLMKDWRLANLAKGNEAFLSFNTSVH